MTKKCSKCDIEKANLRVVSHKRLPYSWFNFILMHYRLVQNILCHCDNGIFAQTDYQQPQNLQIIKPSANYLFWMNLEQPQAVKQMFDTCVCLTAGVKDGINFIFGQPLPPFSFYYVRHFLRATPKKDPSLFYEFYKQSSSPHTYHTSLYLMQILSHPCKQVVQS